MLKKCPTCDGTGYIDPYAELSVREREIVRCVGEGLSNKEIASKLFISSWTVKNHIYAIFIKTGFKTRTRLAIAVADGEIKCLGEKNG